MVQAHSNVIVALLQSSYKLRSVSLQVLAKVFSASVETVSGVERYVPSSLIPRAYILTVAWQPLCQAMAAHPGHTRIDQV